MPGNKERVKEKVKPVPQFRSLEEEAEFWDTHSPLDYPEYWREGKRAKAERPLGHILGVRLDAKVIGEISSIAHSKGIGASTLARMWLMERLNQEQGAQVGRSRPVERPTREAPASRHD